MGPYITDTESTMKLVPSTPGVVSFVLRRESGVHQYAQHFAKFGSVREEVNRAIADWDHPDNRVIQVEIKYAFPVERK
jgi:hypothetical protein